MKRVTELQSNTRSRHFMLICYPSVLLICLTNKRNQDMLRSLIASTSALTLQPAKSQLSPSCILGLMHVRERMRKGTRIKRQLENRKRARIRAEAAKNAPPKKWVPHSVRMRLDSATMKIGGRLEKDALLKKLPEDDVFFIKDFVPYPYSLDEIVKMYRETHAPDMFDQPDAIMQLFIEMDLRTSKKTKFVSSFEGLIHEFKHDLKLPRRRTVLAIVPDLDNQEKALAAGANIVGGNDIIRDLQKGRLKLDDFDELVVHGSMLIPLAPLRGILKKHWPTKQKGNYGPDIADLVNRFLSGVNYEMKKDDFDPSYGFTEFPFARLNMTDDEIRENLEIALSRIDSHKSLTPGKGVKFIRRVFIKCKSDSQEKLLLKHWEVSTLKDLYSDPYADWTEVEVEEEIKPCTSYFKNYREEAAVVVNERMAGGNLPVP